MAASDPLEGRDPWKGELGDERSFEPVLNVDELKLSIDSYVKDIDECARTWKNQLLR